MGKKCEREEIVILLKDLRKQFHILGRAMISEKNITISQLITLFLVAKSSPVKMDILKRELAVTGACATNIVDELVRKNYVCREKGKLDRRIVDVSVTNKGINFVREMTQRERNFSISLVEMLTTEEIGTIKNGLSLLIASLKRMSNSKHRFRPK